MGHSPFHIVHTVMFFLRKKGKKNSVRCFLENGGEDQGGRIDLRMRRRRHASNFRVKSKVFRREQKCFDAMLQ